MYELIRCQKCKCIIKYKDTIISDILDIMYEDEYDFDYESICGYTLSDEDKLDMINDEYKSYLTMKNGKYQWCQNCCEPINIDNSEKIDLDNIAGCGLNKDEFISCVKCKHENNRINCKKTRSDGGWTTVTNYDLYEYNHDYNRKDYNEDDLVDF